MKHLKRFNESETTESLIEEYLKKEFPSTWFDSELEERVFDYISSEEAEDYDDDPVKAYKNLSTGGAVEYDLIELMTEDVCHHFGISRETKFDKRSVGDIAHDHLIDTCTWKDNYVFNRRSTEPYRSHFGFGYDDFMDKWNNLENDSKGTKL
jgi:hypothetical protein